MSAPFPALLDLALRFCPHAERDVSARLWREGRRRKLLNYLWVEFLLARGSARLWGGKPYWLTVDPTNFCQLHCPFCPTGANRGVRTKSEMTLEHFELLMERLGPTLVHVDMINWGESLLHKRLP
ncbi:MAG TPA: radical SAM protein, partial [Elusimicrobiota bacterium]|nr:radical SAM protein [Elusimicrobiota bacterium]